MDAYACLRRRADVAFQVTDAEAILIRMDTGTYYSLNKIGTELWQRLDGQATLAQHADAIAEKYNLILQAIVDDVHQLAEALPSVHAARPRQAASAVRELAAHIPTKHKAEAPAVVAALLEFADEVERAEQLDAPRIASNLLRLGESFPGQFGVEGQMFVNDFVELAKQWASEKLVDVM